MYPGRRSVYCSLIFVLSHMTNAYSVEDICSRRCLYHRGGVLCNCNARHFTGKRSGQATDSSMQTAETARRGQPTHSTNNHFHERGTVDGGTEDEFKNNLADRHIDEHRELAFQQEAGDDDIDNVSTLGVVVGGGDDVDFTRLASHRYLRELEAALRGGWRRNRID